MLSNFFIGPIVGGIIGYITNSIAIKMLFRPLKPVYILGKKLPFTPGMIPKEQARIARTIGEVVSEELIDEKTLKEHLLSQEMVAKIETSITDWIVAQKQSDLTVGEAIQQLFDDKTISMMTALIEEDLSQLIYQKIVDMKLGEPLAKQAVQGIQGNLGPMAMFLGGGLMETAEVKLQEIIQQMIEERGQEVIGEVIVREKENIMDLPVAEVMSKIETELPKVRFVILNQYVSLIDKQLQKMVETINIAEIVEYKIKNYDVLQMEKVILSIVHKELRAIVWLGALLGAIMGLIMNFI